jgi:chromosome partitioning protein
MRTLAITNQKGGTAKTTTAVNLSATLAEKGRQILLIDLDPQYSATSWMGIKDSGRGLLDVFADNGNLLDIVHNTNIHGVDIIPSSSWMVGAEKVLAGEVGSETVLHRNFKTLPTKRWDYILVDCPPTLGILTINALTAVTEILVPVEAHVMALSGLAQLIQTVVMVKKRLNPTLKIAGILACRVDSRTRHALDIVAQLKKKFGNLIYNVYIRENVRIAEAPSFRKPITEYDPKSAGAEDYRLLAMEIINQEKRR